MLLSIYRQATISAHVIPAFESLPQQYGMNLGLTEILSQIFEFYITWFHRCSGIDSIQILQGPFCGCPAKLSSPLTDGKRDLGNLCPPMAAPSTVFATGESPNSPKILGGLKRTRKLSKLVLHTFAYTEILLRGGHYTAFP